MFRKRGFWLTRVVSLGGEDGGHAGRDADDGAGWPKSDWTVRAGRMRMVESIAELETPRRTPPLCRSSSFPRSSVGMPSRTLRVGGTAPAAGVDAERPRRRSH